MRKCSEIKTLDIFDLYSREVVGNIKDIIYDTDNYKISAFVTSEKGVFKDAEILKYDDVTIIGKDVIIIDNKQRLKKLKNYDEISKLIEKDNSLIGNIVICENGEEIGYICDIIIDERNGCIKGFILTDGLIEDLINGRIYLPNMKKIVRTPNSIIINTEMLYTICNCKDEMKNLLGV